MYLIWLQGFYICNYYAIYTWKKIMHVTYVSRFQQFRWVTSLEVGVWDPSLFWGSPPACKHRLGTYISAFTMDVVAFSARCFQPSWLLSDQVGFACRFLYIINIVYILKDPYFFTTSKRKCFLSQQTPPLAILYIYIYSDSEYVMGVPINLIHLSQLGEKVK